MEKHNYHLLPSSYPISFPDIMLCFFLRLFPTERKILKNSDLLFLGICYSYCWTHSENMKNAGVNDLFLSFSCWRIYFSLTVVVFSRQRLSRLTFLKVFCLQTLLSDLKMIGVYTSKIKFHLTVIWVDHAHELINLNNMAGDPNEAPLFVLLLLIIVYMRLVFFRRRNRFSKGWDNIWQEHFRISRQTSQFVCNLVGPHLV